MNGDTGAGGIWRIGGCDSAAWIFPDRPAGSVNQVVDFLQAFVCDSDVAEAELRISADTDFCVWLNGHLIGGGQYSNYPNAKTYERFAIGARVVKGDNRLAVTVFYNGRTSSVYERGEPGVLFEVRGDGRSLVVSGTATQCRPNPCYHSGPIAIVSNQLAYTFGYDARGEDDFQNAGYIPDASWRWIREEEATLPEARTTLLPRPIPRLVDGGCTDARLVDAGRFRFDMDLAAGLYDAAPVRQTLAGLQLEDGSTISPGRQMFDAPLRAEEPQSFLGLAKGWLLAPHGQGLRIDVDPVEGMDGVYLVFDLGREEVGNLALSIDAPEGTIVDIGYGEHLDDGRVRTFVGSRSFAGRYICRAGRNGFDHRFLRWAGRYLQMHVYACSFSLHQLALRRCDYPVMAKGVIDTGKDLHARIVTTGCRTLQLCMHEHYEDTPWREQALYANDARTQALCGYYAFGETAMPAVSMALLGKGLRDDGFINLTAPARPPITIPSFTFAWMLAVRDYHLYSGDDSLSKAFLPQICAMLNRFLAERTRGLLPLRQAKGIWHFYDWSAAMSGYTEDDLAKGLEADLPLNGFFILALDAAVQMLGWCGQPDDGSFANAADTLRAAVAERFWDAGEGVFRTHEYTDRLAELTQALAVLAGVGDAGMRTMALERLSRPDSGLHEPGLSQSYYTFEALMTRKDRYGMGVLRRIETHWGAMLAAGATTFWETTKGASDFHNAGSLCHGWSAVPVYVLFHDVLGVHPLEPGFRTFAVDPLWQAVGTGSGSVPVPGGEITVSWKATGDQLDLRVAAPDGRNRNVS
jgi:alpha-L-rhamnosidase